MRQRRAKVILFSVSINRLTKWQRISFDIVYKEKKTRFYHFLLNVIFRWIDCRMQWHIFIRTLTKWPYNDRAHQQKNCRKKNEATKLKAKNAKNNHFCTLHTHFFCVGFVAVFIFCFSLLFLFPFILLCSRV